MIKIYFDSYHINLTWHGGKNFVKNGKIRLIKQKSWAIRIPAPRKDLEMSREKITGIYGILMCTEETRIQKSLKKTSYQRKLLPNYHVNIEEMGYGDPTFIRVVLDPTQTSA